MTAWEGTIRIPAVPTRGAKAVRKGLERGQEGDRNGSGAGRVSEGKREAAVAYARRGWSVVPLVGGGKVPVPGTGPKSSATDVDVVRGWWEATPDANVGVVARAGGGLVLVDVDAHRGGLDTLRKLVGKWGALPVTPSVATPNGGMHMYFSTGGKLWGNSKDRLGPGVEVRADMAYVVAPPSVLADGREYRWVTEGVLAQAPDWLDVAPVGVGGGHSIKGYREVSEGRLDELSRKGYVARTLAEPDGDQSQHDYHVCGAVRRVGGTPAEGAAMIVRVRGGDRKSERVEYLERTVDRVWAAEKYARGGGGSGKKAGSKGGVSSSGTNPTIRVPAAMGGVTERKIVLERMKDVELEQVAHAWAPYIPLRSVSLLAGKGGVGKSTMHAYLAAALSRGELPGAFEGRPVNVMMVSTEDSAATTMSPRLLACGADMGRVHRVVVQEPAGDGILDLTQDIPELREQARKARVKVVFLDPLVALLSGMDSHNDQQVRRALAPLAQWADQGDLAVNGLIHFNKGESNDALERVSGSGAFGNLARSVMVLGHREEDEDENVVHLIHAKYNLGKKGPAWRCRLLDAPVTRGGKVYPASRIVFEGPSEVHANDLVARASSGDERGQREEAAEFLAVTLAGGPVLTTEVLGMAKQIGISEGTLKRAKKTVGVEAFQSDRAWWWRFQAGKTGGGG